MIKFASELRLKPVLLKREMALVGIVENLVVNPDDGKLVGVLVREGFGKKDLKALPEKDIISIASDFYLISEYGALGEIDEIVRILQVVDRSVRITGAKVYTVSGKYLGKCRDYSMNLKSMKMEKIYVNPPLFSGVMREYVIGFLQIVSIEKSKITVEDTFIKSTIPAKGKLADAVNYT